MFTGLVEETGTIAEVVELPDSARRLTIAASVVCSDAKPGDSICVDGVCLTAVDPTHTSFQADVMAESLQRSTLGWLTVGDRVNLERSMSPQTRFGGHIVSGHVDAVTQVVDRQDSENWRILSFALPSSLVHLVAEKGSITVSGVSLTVASVQGSESFSVSLIPTTLAETTLGALQIGDSVNLEVDMLARYVARILETR